MKQELDEALVRDFPNLYRDRNRSMRETCMCWGFCCGNGWEPLIRRLSEKLEAMIMEIPESEIDPDIGRPCAAQVKEKFGGLRVYVTSGTDAMYDAINEAEEESTRTCEDCGAPGECRDGSWLRTLCNTCDEKRKKR